MTVAEPTLSSEPSFPGELPPPDLPIAEAAPDPAANDNRAPAFPASLAFGPGIPVSRSAGQGSANWPRVFP